MVCPITQGDHNNYHGTTTTNTTVLRPFVRDYPSKPVPEETPSSVFYGAREDNRGRRNDNPAGRKNYNGTKTKMLCPITVTKNYN